jgi:hypothetical protein
MKGTIKITDEKLTTKPFEGQDGATQVWVKTNVLDKSYIFYDGSMYKLHVTPSKK